MYLFVPDLSPSSPVAIGAYKTTGGDEKIRYFPKTGQVYMDGTSELSATLPIHPIVITSKAIVMGRNQLNEYGEGLLHRSVGL